MRSLGILLLILLQLPPTLALERTGVEFKIFQFPADRIPRIDGDPDDWSIVPASYAIGLDQLRESPMAGGPTWTGRPRRESEGRLGEGSEPALLPLRGVRQLLGLRAHRPAQRHLRTGRGWRSFRRTPDRSDGTRTARLSRADTHFQLHGVHAQNYHIFTPAPRARTGRWSGAASRGSRICPRRTRPTATTSNPARRASWCWSSGSRLSTMRPPIGPRAPSSRS